MTTAIIHTLIIESGFLCRFGRSSLQLNGGAPVTVSGDWDACLMIARRPSRTTPPRSRCCDGQGSPPYYGKRGFQAAEAAGFRAPSLRYPDGAFQVVRPSAHEPWMTGTFVYSETFWALDCVGLRGERLRAARGEA
jgi:hypothetical protein